MQLRTINGHALHPTPLLLLPLKSSSLCLSWRFFGVLSDIVAMSAEPIPTMYISGSLLIVEDVVEELGRFLLIYQKHTSFRVENLTFFSFHLAGQAYAQPLAAG